ncbi:MAG TPA: TetR/AcrR family transcriptional regulator [Xanthobacteraceae bacterium]|nr:TetR/AcrR family transcriptional regulator [Xanthobacteraceae bacterium]
MTSEISVSDQPVGRDISRRLTILAAAERAFVRHGFHASTMHDVAVEAGMSPGNLYRYFPSKDAIVAGLCECDQEQLADDFAGLAAARDVVGAIERMLRKRLIEEPREPLQLIVEIWAESTRNPVIAAIQSKVDGLVRERLLATVEAAKRLGAAAPGIDVDFAVRALMTIGAGLFKRRVLEPDFDGEVEVAVAVCLIRTVFRGLAQPAPAGGFAEARA